MSTEKQLSFDEIFNNKNMGIKKKKIELSENEKIIKDGKEYYEFLLFNEDKNKTFILDLICLDSYSTHYSAEVIKNYFKEYSKLSFENVSYFIFRKIKINNISGQNSDCYMSYHGIPFFISDNICGENKKSRPLAIVKNIRKFDILEYIKFGKDFEVIN